MDFLDTQIVALAFNSGINQNISHANISSVVASEFLLVYSDKPMEANYYFPNMHMSLEKHAFSADGLPLSFTSPNGTLFRKKHADKIVLDFGKEFNRYIEFGSYSIAEIINKKLHKTYLGCIEDLPKERKKLLKKKIYYLLENDIKCHPINPQSIQIAYELLHRFITEYSMKSNVRNSINDMLILSAAIEKRGNLISQDHLLNEFACKQVDGQLRKTDDVVVCDFTNNSMTKTTRSRESKGYINRGWKFTMYNR